MADDKEIKKPGDVEEEIKELDELSAPDLKRVAGDSCNPGPAGHGHPLVIG